MWIRLVSKSVGGSLNTVLPSCVQWPGNIEISNDSEAPKRQNSDGWRNNINYNTKTDDRIIFKILSNNF
jgi:hypothetical protein